MFCRVNSQHSYYENQQFCKEFLWVFRAHHFHIENRLFGKCSNALQFPDTAIKFGQICDYIYVPLYLVLGIVLLSAGGFWGIIFGIAFLIGAVGSVHKIYTRRKKQKDFFEQNSVCPSCGKRSTKKNFCSICGAKMPKLSAREVEAENELTDESIKDKKKKLLWTPIVLIIIIFVLTSGMLGVITGTDPISNTKSITLDNYDHSFGEMASNHIDNAKWEKEKLDTGKYNVTVEGYCAGIGEDLKITFRYKELDDQYYQVSVEKVELPDSNEEYTDIFNIALILGYFNE